MSLSLDVRPVVLFFKETLLPVSETFVLAQAMCLSKFSPRFIGLGRVRPSLDVPADSILLSSGYSPVASLRQKVYRRVSLAPTFHRRAAEARATLIHAHFASGGRSALPLARSLRLPLLVTLHGSDVTRRVDFRARYSHLWERASLFLCVSDFIRRKALEAGFPEHKLRVHYIGVDVDVFRPVYQPRQRDLILFVGRLFEKKGCEFMLQAVAQVKKSRPNCRAFVVGDGPLRPSLEQLAKKLGISCQFLGSQPGAAIRKWLSSATVFCAPSVTAENGDCEGLGIVFAEAQAMGTPVASFRHGGIPEVVLDGQTGLLAPERDIETLTGNILRLLEDEVLWRQYSQRGPEWIRQRFDLKLQTEQMERVYLDLCQSRPKLEHKANTIEHSRRL
jgi:glycosyltransferase involved in cell wall biosynthesis